MPQSRLLLIALVSTAFSGCAMTNWMFPPAPFSDRTPCVLSPSATKAHIVQHINLNIQGTATTSGLASWHSSSVKVTVGGLPMRLPAQIAVEAPRNFRLRVSAPIGGAELVDIGSNDEHFWFWAQDSPQPNVILARHDEMLLEQQMNIPFNPDWLMEVFGVIPMDPDNVTLSRPNLESPIVDLVSEHTSPSGGHVRKVVRVHSCHGIVVEHALYDSRGVLIASARLGNHRRDDETGIVTPRHVRLEWTQMRQRISIDLADMRVNPPDMPSQVWQIPEKPGYPPLPLSQLLHEQHGSGFSPFGDFGSATEAPTDESLQQETRSDDRVDPFLLDDNLTQSPPKPFTVPASATAPPSAYSAGASQSSSVPPRRARGLWRWPWGRRK